MDEQKNQEEYKRFEAASKKFSQIFNELNTNNIDSIDKYIDPFWKGTIQKVEDFLLPIPPFNFLDFPEIMNTMVPQEFGDRFVYQYNYLKNKLTEPQLKTSIEENVVGDPTSGVVDFEITTSSNAVHQAYHIHNWLDKTKTNVNKVNTIFEWGGGYGNMAKLVKRIFDNKNLTYILADIPIFCALQWLYLSSVFGEENINVITPTKQAVKPGKINIISVGSLKLLQGFKPDLFLSTWALSESQPEALEVFDVLSGGIEHYLVAMHLGTDLFNKETVQKLVSYLENEGCRKEKMEFFPQDEQYYFLK